MRIKKIYPFILIIPLLFSCNKIVKEDAPKSSWFDNTLSSKSIVNGAIFHIEDFRKPGMSDYETFMAAYDSIPNYSNLIFADKTYTLDHSPVIYKVINFYGPAVIKREDQVTYTLQESASQSSSIIVLNSTKGISAGDGIFISFGPADADNTAVDFVKQVSGDSVFLQNSIGATSRGMASFPLGSVLFKSIELFWIIGSDSYPFIGCSFNNLTFDGNRDNNRGSVSWRINSAVLAITKNTTRYDHCNFINSPGETIIGHNADIRNCFFSDLNGSAFHASADKVTWVESDIHSYLYNNIIQNTNQVPDSIGGHSEGAITHSDSGGYYVATGNTFINIGGPVLGLLYPSVSIHDWGTSEITFTGNTINGARKIVWAVSMQPGIIHDVRINSNIISNMAIQGDWSTEMNYFDPGLIIFDKTGQ